VQRRMLALFAGIAVGASALLGAAPASAADAPPGGFPYVALGDSEAAGSGLLPEVQLDCTRSIKAYPIIIAPLYEGVASHACAGATTADALAQAQTAIAAGRLGPATELVTITVGMNDVGWQSVLLACSSTGSEPACQTAFGQAMAIGQLLPQRIAALVLTVRTAAPTADVMVGGYPLLFGDVVAPCSIGSFAGTAVAVTPAQAALANFGVTQINLAIRAGTMAAGGTYVDIGAAFDGHGLCDTSGPWVSGLVNGQRTADRSLHLNWPGQRAYAAAILAEL
jgi:lysophospholipase L1-like esterase